MFDEKHYVPQAWQMLRNGGVEDNPGYELVVHPPLGKQLIALGELTFGYDGFGWRAAAALAGTLTVLLVVRAGRRLTRSTMLGGLAGVLLICDGLSHVQSRMGMLDAFSALFVVAAFATLLCDRDDVRARMARGGAARAGSATPGTARGSGVRWWRLATGVLLGLGCGVKWSGVYWLAAFAVLMLFWDSPRAGWPAWSGRCAAPWSAISGRRCGRWPWCRCWPTCRAGGPGSAARRRSTGTPSGRRSAPADRGRSCPTRCAGSGTTAARCWPSTPG